MTTPGNVESLVEKQMVFIQASEMRNHTDEQLFQYPSNLSYGDELLKGVECKTL